jgi:hypothetical protein
MAYKNLIGIPCNNSKQTFQHLRDFLCSRNGTYDYDGIGIGWTLVDAVYAVDEDNITLGDYFVVKTTGETPGNTEIYILIKMHTTGATITINGYRFWDAATHSGVGLYGYENYGLAVTADTNNTLWVYGDLDTFYVIAKFISTYNLGGAGWVPDSVIDQTRHTPTAAITSGSDVVVSFSAVPAAWAVDMYLFVSDNAHIERVRIKSITGLNVTFYTFVNSYTADCKFNMERTEYARNGGTCVVEINHAGTLADVNVNILYPAGYSATSDPLVPGYKVARYGMYYQSTTILNLPHILCAPSSWIETQESLHTADDTYGYRYMNTSGILRMLIREV